MKSLQTGILFGLLLMLFVHVANGFQFYGPYDVYNSRTARWPAKDIGNKPSVGNNGSGYCVYNITDKTVTTLHIMVCSQHEGKSVTEERSSSFIIAWNGFPNELDFYRIISHLNDVGKRRK